MKKIFTEEDLTLLIEALAAQEADVKEDIMDAEEIKAPDSVIFAYSKEMIAVQLMKQFFENVHKQEECMFAEGCTKEEAIQMSRFTERK